jgi:negative regulator of flagellin synthesis FlgM
MAINFNNIGSNQVRDQQRAESAVDGRKANDAATGSTNAAADDRVQLSASAKALQALASGVTHLPAVDASRVDAIRQQISEGRYHVDPLRLAQKFIEIEGEL